MNNTSSLGPLRENHCPLCGEPNHCAPAACGSFDVNCWCKSVKIAQDNLQKIPECKRGIACVCERCASAASTSVLND